jgi:hypothetical protein
MRNFLRNLALLAILAIALFLVAPDTVKGVLGIYNGLGLLPIVAIMVILAALPRKPLGRRRRKGRVLDAGLVLVGPTDIWNFESKSCSGSIRSGEGLTRTGCPSAQPRLRS